MGDKGGGKLHRLVFCQFDIIDLGEGEDAEFFLANGFSARLREEFLFEFFADLLFELFFNDRLGGFARTIAGELGEFALLLLLFAPQVLKLGLLIRLFLSRAKQGQTLRFKVSMLVRVVRLR